MRLGLLLAVFMCFASNAADRITARITVTNENGTVNGKTLTVNGNVRTWTNNVVVPASQILTNLTREGSKTNMYNAIGLVPFAGVVMQDYDSTNISLISPSGVPLTATVSAGWGLVTYSTQTVASLTAVRVPMSGEASGGAATNIASLTVKGENDLSTNSFYENAITVQNLVGKTNVQTDITGGKVFIALTGRWGGVVSNSPSIGGTVQGLTNGFYKAPYLFAGVASNMIAISGNALLLTNGLFSTPILRSPTLSNGVNYGTAFSSPGAGAFSQQFGGASAAAGDNSTALGVGTFANGDDSVAFGSGAVADGDSTVAIGSGAFTVELRGVAIGRSAAADKDGGVAIGNNAEAAFTNSVALGTGAISTRENQIFLGSDSDTEVNTPGYLKVDGGGKFGAALTNTFFSGKTTFPAQSDVSFGRYALSSLANGINQDIVVGTNVFVQVSGPTGAFSIEGIAGGRDGKLVIILNRTGFNMTIATEGGATGNDPTAANRIICLSGADRATTGDGAAILIYNSSESRWILLSLDP